MAAPTADAAKAVTFNGNTGGSGGGGGGTTASTAASTADAVKSAVGTIFDFVNAEGGGAGCGAVLLVDGMAVVIISIAAFMLQAFMQPEQL